MADQQRLSIQLFEVLEEVGASESLRKFHHKTAVEMGILRTLVTCYNSNDDRDFFICGSRYDGSVTPKLGSDIDIIHSPIKLRAALDPTFVSDGMVFLKDHWTYPGYVKLQCVKDGCPLNFNNKRTTKLKLYDVMGRLCFEQFNGDNMHGPAYRRMYKDGIQHEDFVFALRCDTIPDYVNAWITRKRKHSWPTLEQLETMSKMGCMVVSASHWKSCERDIEWRISFSLQERVLMSSLNSVQHKVYVVLKIIKKQILERIPECESFTSYHCKTCVLHAVEQTPATFWTKGNLINCILYCLRLLSRWVDDNFCPSYFIKEQNIFSKECFRRSRDNLRNELKQIIQMEHMIPYILESDSINILLVGDMLINKCYMGTRRKHGHLLNLKQHIIMHILFIIHLIHKSKDLLFTLGELLSMNSLKNHPKYETQKVLSYLQPWLHLHVAKSLTAQAIVTQDKYNAEILLRRANEHFVCGSRTNLTTVRLSKASILYTYGHYEQCVIILQEIERYLIFQVISHCPCKNDYQFHKDNMLQENDFIEKIEKICSLSDTDMLEDHVTICIVFTRSESRIVPTALQYEMYRSLDTEPGSRDKQDIWFDSAAVDASIYLYFLQYLAYEALNNDMSKQEALDNIEAEIEKCNDLYTKTGTYRLHHKDTAYNLLTWIYLRQKRDAKAIRYFTESLKIRPDHNAAKFLIRDMYLF